MLDDPGSGASPRSGGAATQAFLDHRPLLFSVVYTMLGTVADTEDVLQETWLSWTSRALAPAAEPVDQPRAYLVRIAINQAIARRAADSRRRETYVGQWLPEPLLTPLTGADAGAPEDGAEAAVRAESFSVALLVLLETLSPLERAVFVLHEGFGFGHGEIAGLLGRSPLAVRQLAHRARDHVRRGHRRYRADPRVHRQVTERFLAAARGGDLEALMELLAPDVTLWTDGGGQGPATSPHPVHGATAVARLLVRVAARLPIDVDLRYRRGNGDPAVVLLVAGSPVAVLVLDLDDDDAHRVRGIYSITNPDKLSRAR